MRIISRKPLRQFWENPRYPGAERPLKEWLKVVSEADWATPAEVKDAFRSASFVRDNRVVFNIGGNKYRLVVRINYDYRVVYVRFVGTHTQYDNMDAGVI